MAGRRQRAAYLGPARRRPMILEAACSVFAECGYGGARMEAIAARAGVRKPLVYDCFPGGKEEIFLAALAQSVTTFERHRRQTVGSGADLSLEEAVRWELTAFVEISRSDPSALAVLLHRPATPEGRIVDEWARSRNHIIATIEGALRPYLNAAAMEGAAFCAEAVVATATVTIGLDAPTASVVEPLVTFLMGGFESLLQQGLDVPDINVRRQAKEDMQ
jgi:AcrR family transcriptional regulator